MQDSNKLIDVSIKTMIGNLPAIINKNNESISNEFEHIYHRDSSNNRDYVVIDVSCLNVFSQSGTFNSLRIGSTVVNQSTIESLDPTINTINASINQIDASIAQIMRDISTNGRYGGSGNMRRANQYVNESSLDSGSSTRTIYGAGAKSSNEIDMSGFFTESMTGKIIGYSIDELPYLSLYRKLGAVRIPLQIGTTVHNGKIIPAVYHMNFNPVQKSVQAVCVGLDDSEREKAIV